MAQTTHSTMSRENGATFQDIKEKGAEQLHRMADKATDQLGNVANTVQDVAGRVAEQGRDAGERIQEVAGNMQSAIDKSLKEQPLTTLAIAAAAGFALGALWKS